MIENSSNGSTEISGSSNGLFLKLVLLKCKYKDLSIFYMKHFFPGKKKSINGTVLQIDSVISRIKYGGLNCQTLKKYRTDRKSAYKHTQQIPPPRILGKLFFFLKTVCEYFSFTGKFDNGILLAGLPLKWPFLCNRKVLSVVYS